MAKFYPITVGFQVSGTSCKLFGVKWRDGNLAVDFGYLEEGASMRAVFREVSIFRVIDSVPLPDRDEPLDGIVKNHIAYLVRDSEFALHHSECFSSEAASPPSHYRLVTGWGTVDVIGASTAPFQNPASADAYELSSDEQTSFRWRTNASVLVASIETR